MGVAYLFLHMERSFGHKQKKYHTFMCNKYVARDCLKKRTSYVRHIIFLVDDYNQHGFYEGFHPLCVMASPHFILLYWISKSRRMNTSLPPIVCNPSSHSGPRKVQVKPRPHCRLNTTYVNVYYPLT